MNESWAYLIGMAYATLLLATADFETQKLIWPIVTLAFTLCLYEFSILYTRELKTEVS